MTNKKKPFDLEKKNKAFLITHDLVYVPGAVNPFWSREIVESRKP